MSNNLNIASDNPEACFVKGEALRQRFLESREGLEDSLVWLTRAAKHGHGMAFFNLGLVHFDWEYQSRNLVEAFMWFYLASKTLKLKKDRSKAESRLRKLAREMSEAQKQEAFEWASDFFNAPVISKRNIFGFLKEKIPAVSDLGVSCLADVVKVLEERFENEKHDRGTQPVSPPPRSVRVIHRFSTVKIPKPTVLIDSREPERFAYTFERIGKWFSGFARKALKTGDYSLEEWEDEITIERKTLDDLVGSVMPPNRERFIGECERMAGFKRKAIVVEASLEEVKSPYMISAAHPNAVVGTLFAIQERWDIPIIWAGNRELAEETVAHILSKFHALRWLEENNHPRHFIDGDI